MNGEYYLSAHDLALWCRTEPANARIYVTVLSQHSDDLVVVSACVPDVKRGLASGTVTFVCDHGHNCVDIRADKFDQWDIWTMPIQ